ncbi:MAG: chitobiase/beta-hexosaminidase C-terminal domain-containing protein [Saprospiraceae bacterium]|nr:chitobiase/beta-hexosaminidase C-terminal domain-containing protein [Saprospiraceae bacterium]
MTRGKVISLLNNVAFALNALLLVLLLGEGRLVIPDALATAGRFHIVMLHLPIGLIFVLPVIAWVNGKGVDTSLRKLEQIVLHLVAVLTASTALAGLFLTFDAGYDPAAAKWHKWLGSLLAFASYVTIRIHGKNVRKGYYFALAVLMGLVFWAGHLGGKMTHGDHFLFPPDKIDHRPNVDEHTPIFTAFIKPILDQHCVSCHRDGKAKGKLVMTNVSGIVQGGASGPLVMATRGDESEMIKRMRLPLDHEDHMPPRKKSQPSEADIDLIKTWIDLGADFDQSLADLDTTESAEVFRSKYSSLPKATVAYDFDAADADQIADLNTPFRAVRPTHEGSPALDATIFVRAVYEPVFLEELAAVGDQIVSLSLLNLPVRDEELSTVGDFKNLEKLILNGTDIDGSGLAYLRNCSQLRSLGLSECQVDFSQLQVLADFPSLREISLWNTPISPEQITALKKDMPGVQFELGYVPDPSEQVSLSPPILINEELIIKSGEMIELKNMFEGVETRYTLDGSEPDSSSLQYEGPFPLTSAVELKVRAYRDGWQPSRSKSYGLYMVGHEYEAELVTSPNPQYPGSGANGLHDLTFGKTNSLKSPAWLAYREGPMVATLTFAKDTDVDEVVVKCGQNIGAWVLAPQQISVWGGADVDHLHKIGEIVPPASKEGGGNRDLPLRVKVTKGSYKVLRLEVQPLKRLPSWHQGAGNPSWVFVDEVFVYG